MSEETAQKDCKDYICKRHTGAGAGCGGIYGLAFVGAAVYYIQHSEGFWLGVLGLLKALVWPAMLIYKLFGLLNM